MRPLLERLGGFLPAAIALALPTVFIPIAVDSYILPRASIVIAGAGLGAGIALLLPGRPRLGSLRLPLLAAGLAATLAYAFSVNQGVSLAGSYTRYESMPIRLSYLALLAVSVLVLLDPRALGPVAQRRAGGPCRLPRPGRLSAQGTQSPVGNVGRGCGRRRRPPRDPALSPTPSQRRSRTHPASPVAGCRSHDRRPTFDRMG